MTAKIYKFPKKEKAVLPTAQEIAAHNTVEHMRKEILHLENSHARMQYLLCLIAQISLWVIKAGHYDKPGDMLRSWVDRKVKAYEKEMPKDGTN